MLLGLCFFSVCSPLWAFSSDHMAPGHTQAHTMLPVPQMKHWQLPCLLLCTILFPSYLVWILGIWFTTSNMILISLHWLTKWRNRQICLQIFTQRLGGKRFFISKKQRHFRISVGITSWDCQLLGQISFHEDYYNSLSFPLNLILI